MGRMAGHDKWLAEYDAALKQLYGKSEKVKMDMTQFSESESQWLKAKDFVGKNLKVQISDIEVVHFDADDKNPERNIPGLKFEGKEKGLIINKTNTQSLINAYGQNSDDWIGRNVGLSVADYRDKGFGFGWIVTPLDVKPPEFDPDVGF